MQTRKLGNSGPTVSAIGLGCMGMSDLYGPADDAESIATIRAALDAGVTLLDTGDYYGMGHNELLIRDALAAWPGQGRRQCEVRRVARPDRRMAGVRRPPRGREDLSRLYAPSPRDDYVDIYRPGRLDPAVPIEETVGAIADLIKAGHVRHIGLSEVGSDTVRRAHADHPVSICRSSIRFFPRGIETEILPACRELGVGVTAYGVLSRGLLSGHCRSSACSPPATSAHTHRVSAARIWGGISLWWTR